MGVPATFKTRPCLTLIPDLEDDARRGRWSRRAETVETPAGAFVRHVADATGVLTHTLTFTCATRADVHALQAFVDARRGRYEAFWFPTWLHEYELVTANSAGATFLLPDVSPWPIGSALWPYVYAASYRPSGLALQFIQLDASAAGVLTFGATRAGDASWSLSPVAAIAIGRLAYGRFDSDSLEIDWHGIQGAHAVTVTLVELPQETPA